MARSVGRGAEVVAWRRLTGGITASMHRLTVRTPAEGAPRHVVLRRWMPRDNDAWMAWARATVVNEGRTLDALAASAVPAPRLIACDDGSETGGVPALLMTQIGGRMNLTPKDQGSFVSQMASTLARIHGLAIEAPPREPWIDPDKVEVPPWTTRPNIWRAAIDAIRNPADGPSGFIHGDYQHFNLLWMRERLAGVVDWPNASSGPFDIDVGHCRLNLAVLFSNELSDEFLRAYEAEAGRVVNARSDLESLLSYDQEWKRFIPIQVHGRTSVDLAGMDERVEDTIAAAVSRL